MRNVATLVLYNSEGKILLQHRTEDALHLPGYWAFFGGAIEEKETPQQALKREIFEELEYPTADAYLLVAQKFRYGDEENESTKYVFVEKYNEEIPLHIHEGQGMDWFLPNETKNLKIIDRDISIINEIDMFIKSSI